MAGPAPEGCAGPLHLEVAVPRVVLVCGPPCAGKTTYVRARAQPNDLVLDQDVIGAKAMTAALARLPARRGDGTAWVIRCSPGKARRTALAERLGAEVVLLVPDQRNLMARATHRSNPRRVIQSIRSWIQTEQRNPPPISHRPPDPKAAADRGYGYQHRKLRAVLVKDAIGKPCVRCGMPMLQGQPLDLDHTDDRSGYRGMAHMSCNRRAGAIKGNKMRRPRSRFRRSRAW